MTILSYMTQLPGTQIRGIKNIIAVGSGKGGVGKSTVAVNIAATLSTLGVRVGILDADIYGPSIPQLLGQVSPLTNDGEKYFPVEAHGIQAMSIGYLTEQAMPLIWRGPMLAKSMIQLLDSTRWDQLDYLLIDLPPGTGDIQLSLVQKIPLAAAIIVTTPQSVATADAEKALVMFQKTNIHVLGIIENMSMHICEQCGHHSSLFGYGGAETLAQAHQCPILGQLPLHTTIRENSDQGIPAVFAKDPAIQSAFKQIATTILEKMSIRPINYANKFPPIMVE